MLDAIPLPQVHTQRLFLVLHEEDLSRLVSSEDVTFMIENVPGLQKPLELKLSMTVDEADRKSFLNRLAEICGEEHLLCSNSRLEIRLFEPIPENGIAEEEKGSQSRKRKPRK